MGDGGIASWQVCLDWHVGRAVVLINQQEARLRSVVSQLIPFFCDRVNWVMMEDGGGWWGDFPDGVSRNNPMVWERFGHPGGGP